MAWPPRSTLLASNSDNNYRATGQENSYRRQSNFRRLTLQIGGFELEAIEACESYSRMIPSRRICLLIDTSTSWGARLIRGVSRHAQEAGDWLIHVEPWGRYERFRVPEGWDGHGIIARVNHQALAEEIAASRLPAINLSWYPFSNERI